MKKFTTIKNPVKRTNENQEIPNTEIQKTDGDKSPAVLFFSKLFESKEMAHVYHLQVKGQEGSHADHTALGDYYENVVEVIDELIEVYMGQYDVIEGYDVIDTSPSREIDPIEYFNGIGSYIKSERYKVISEDDTHIHSIIDEVSVMVYRLLYKLKYNK